MRGGLGLIVMALALAGCRPAAPPSQTPSGDAGHSPLPPPVPTAETSGAPTTGPRPTPTQPKPRPERDTMAIRVPSRAAQISIVELLASPAHNGTVILVTGRCLGVEPGLAAGPPPSRGAWVLESESAYIYVVGPFPAGCTLTTPGSTTNTLRVRVVEDTLPSMTGARMPRRYLALMR